MSFLARQRTLIDPATGPGQGLPAAAVPDQPAGPRRHRAPGWLRLTTAVLLTVLAAVLVLVALQAPTRLSLLSRPRAFLRIPGEAVLLALLLIALPRRPARILAVVVGLGLGALLALSLMDVGFNQVLARPFHPVYDWVLLGDAADFVKRTYGKAGEIGAAVLAVLIGIGLVSLLAASMLRLTALARRHRRLTAGGGAVIGVVWVLCAVLGVQLLHGLPIASHGAAALTIKTAAQIRAGLKDSQQFAGRLNTDAFAATPRTQLLDGLHGKDVVLAFVEAYGRTAVEDPSVLPVLDQGSAQLAAAGFGVRSGWLSSSTFGGSSWLAHSTLQSGLWVDNQGRYQALTHSHRLTLASAFAKAGWRTVCLTPATNQDWPEGVFYDFGKVYDDRNLGYRGRTFGYSTMPDQYTVAVLQRQELAAAHPPLMAELDLTSSHLPWTLIPRTVDWSQLGDGSIFSRTPVVRDTGTARGNYLQTIRYSVSTLISFLTTYRDDDNMVMVFLGDHQPWPAVSGRDTRHDVPITIVARDPKVLQQISSWGWQSGLTPGKTTPIWPMDQFRDKFLAAFTSR